MKLNPKIFRYLSNEDFRVLTATEMGSKNHEVVPTTLISSISGFEGGIKNIISDLARNNLISRGQNIKYDGYRLTYGGYDYLALRAFAKRGMVGSVGRQIGVGKESDVYVVCDDSGKECVLKLQRLGRISFRAVKNKRDYLKKRKSASWMYLSRLGATKEFAFMNLLYEHGFPVPKPLDHNRHCVLMELIDGFPLHQVSRIDCPEVLFSDLMELIVELARCGLIHGDFNEFNILIRNSDHKPVVIDFPQMVSTSHPNAEYYFERDVNCIVTYFKKRFNFESLSVPEFKKDGCKNVFKLDVKVEASGFSRKQAKELEIVNL